MPSRSGHPHFRRSRAALRIQKAWRRRKRRYTRSTRKGALVPFRARVNRAVLSTEPVQYRLFGNNSIALSQTPTIITNFSDLKFDNSNANPRFYRTSMKVKVMNLWLKMRFDVADTVNQVCIALIRHKRSEPIVDADIQAALGGPLLTQNDKPFMNMSVPNSDASDMTGISASARPDLLQQYWNPKQVDVLKTWTVNMQNYPAGGQTANLSAFKPYLTLDYNHKFNETWKYPEDRAGVLAQSFPYNNKCYQLIGWSDSVAATAHPTVTCQSRVSFKDLD